MPPISNRPAPQSPQQPSAVKNSKQDFIAEQNGRSRLGNERYEANEQLQMDAQRDKWIESQGLDPKDQRNQIRTSTRTAIEEMERYFAEGN